VVWVWLLAGMLCVLPPPGGGPRGGGGSPVVGSGSLAAMLSFIRPNGWGSLWGWSWGGPNGCGPYGGSRIDWHTNNGMMSMERQKDWLAK